MFWFLDHILAAKLSSNIVGISSKANPLLRTCIVALGRKSLWPQATSPLLLLRRYSGNTVVIGRRRPSLLQRWAQ
jgi:hypothetical protein